MNGITVVRWTGAVALILAVSLGSMESTALAARGGRGAARVYANRGNAYDYRGNRNRRNDWNRQDRLDRRRDWYGRDNWYGRYGRPYGYYPGLYAARGLARGYGYGGDGGGYGGDSYSGNGYNESTYSAPQQTAHSGGWLGVILDTNYDDRAIVAQVYRNSPAAQAGIRPGDEIVSFNGRPLRTREQLTALVSAGHPGDQVNLEVVYDNQVHAMPATLGERLAD